MDLSINNLHLTCYVVFASMSLQQLAFVPVVKEDGRRAFQDASAVNRDEDAQWHRVRQIAAGREVQVTRVGESPQRRVYVAADANGLTVLNVSEPLLPRRARRIIERLVTADPDLFVRPGRLYIEGDIRLDRAGLFIDSRLVVERSRLIEGMERNTLRELRYAGPGGTYWRRGLVTGLVSGALFVSLLGFYDVYALAAGALAAGAGAAAGATIGVLHKRHSSEVIYSVPSTT
jgi:hypothetical protein